jgi:hypothetical protein
LSKTAFFCPELWHWDIIRPYALSYRHCGPVVSLILSNVMPRRVGFARFRLSQPAKKINYKGEKKHEKDYRVIDSGLYGSSGFCASFGNSGR